MGRLVLKQPLPVQMTGSDVYEPKAPVVLTKKPPRPVSPSFVQCVSPSAIMRRQNGQGILLRNERRPQLCRAAQASSQAGGTAFRDLDKNTRQRADSPRRQLLSARTAFRLQEGSLERSVSSSLAKAVVMRKPINRGPSQSSQQQRPQKAYKQREGVNETKNCGANTNGAADGFLIAARGFCFRRKREPAADKKRRIFG